MFPMYSLTIYLSIITYSAISNSDKLNPVTTLLHSLYEAEKTISARCHTCRLLLCGFHILANLHRIPLEYFKHQVKVYFSNSEYFTICHNYLKQLTENAIALWVKGAAEGKQRCFYKSEILIRRINTVVML